VLKRVPRAESLVSSIGCARAHSQPFANRLFRCTLRISIRGQSLENASARSSHVIAAFFPYPLLQSSLSLFSFFFAIIITFYRDDARYRPSGNLFPCLLPSSTRMLSALSQRGSLMSLRERYSMISLPEERERGEREGGWIQAWVRARS